MKIKDPIFHASRDPFLAAGIGRVQSSDMNMGGGPVIPIRVASLIAHTERFKSFSTVQWFRIVGVRAPLAESGPRSATGMLIYY